MQWIILLLSFTMTLGFKTLSNSQWSNINNILRITKDEHIQTKIRNVIYEYYESWAIHQSHVFKQYHSYLCKDIKGDDLAMFGCIGLQKSTINYDATKCGVFAKYADFYIKGELYKGVRKLKPQVHCSSHIDYLHTAPKAPILQLDLEFFTEKWESIKKSLTNFEYRCVIYKYSFEFIKEMPNSHIAKLMSCSEETVRKAIVKADGIIYSPLFV